MDTLRKRIAVVGSINTDMVVKSSHIPRPGETVLGGSFMMNSGGKGANQAVAAARLGGDVCFIARVGNDALGERAVKLFREEGIDTSAISIDETHASGVALIMVDEKGENCISVASGANAALSPIEIEASAPIIENSALLLAQLETPVATVGRAARIARKAGATVVLNPAPACPLPKSLLRDVDIIIPNETEASILSGIEVADIESARKAAEKIVASGVAVVIITMGAAGALIYKDFHPTHIPSLKVKAVDTTAAGDTFCGAFVVALSEGRSIEDAVRFATRCAAISVTRPGAQISQPRRNEVPE